MVRFLVVEPVHPSSSPRLGMGACTFLDSFQDLTALFFHAPVMTSSILTHAGSVTRRVLIGIGGDCMWMCKRHCV